MAGRVWSVLLAALLLGGVVALVAMSMSGEARRDRERAERMAEADRGAERAAAIMDQYLSPEQKFRNRRVETLRGLLEEDRWLEAGSYPQGERQALYELAAGLIIDNVCSREDLRRAPLAPHPGSGSMPVYRADCPQDSPGKQILVYPASREYRVVEPG